MMLNANIRIELTHEQQVEAVISILCEDYHHLAVSAHEYEKEMRTRVLEDFELQDYNDFLKSLKGMDAVLENYMTQSDYETWCKAWKKTRALYV